MEKLHAFHTTKKGYLTFGIAETILLYIAASIATDTANMFAYLAAVLLFFGALINFINVIKPQSKKANTKPTKKNAHAG